MPRSRRWTSDSVGQAENASGFGRGTTKWEPTLAFPKTGTHRATLGDRLFAEVHIDVKMQADSAVAVPGTLNGAATRGVIPFIESIVYDYMGVRDGRTLVIRETSRQGERIERSMLYARLNANGPTKIRFPSGAVSIEIDDEQVAVVRWAGP